MSDPWIAFLLKHALAGVLAGWTAVALLLWTDVGRLGTLILAAEQPWLPFGMLLAGFGITFGSVAMGAAIMSLGRPDRPRRGQPQLLTATLRRLSQTRAGRRSASFRDHR
jgi:hypothetical protein